ISEGAMGFKDRTALQHPGAPAPAGTSFTLYADRAQALQPPDKNRQRFVIYFPESLRGLSVGAPVDFRGIVIGEVKSLGVEYGKAGAIRFPVAMDVYPGRLRPRSVHGSSPRPATRAGGNGLINRLNAQR